LRRCGCHQCLQKAEELEELNYRVDAVLSEKDLCWCGKIGTHLCENGKGYGASCVNRVCSEHAYCAECYAVPDNFENACVICNGEYIWNPRRGAYVCNSCGYVPPNR